jgi:hypothetical protein
MSWAGIDTSDMWCRRRDEKLGARFQPDYPEGVFLSPVWVELCVRGEVGDDHVDEVS